MRHQLAVLALWLIAGVVTWISAGDPRILGTVGPVFAICMIGSVITVRAALRR